jgi:hypothetical protein
VLKHRWSLGNISAALQLGLVRGRDDIEGGQQFESLIQFDRTRSAGWRQGPVDLVDTFVA